MKANFIFQIWLFIQRNLETIQAKGSNPCKGLKIYFVSLFNRMDIYNLRKSFVHKTVYCKQFNNF